MTPSMTACPPTSISSGDELTLDPAINSSSGLVQTVFFLETLDPAGRIDQFLLAGEKRMTSGAKLQPNLRFCRPGLELVSTSTSHQNFDILRMNAFFHIDLILIGHFRLAARPKP